MEKVNAMKKRQKEQRKDGMPSVFVLQLCTQLNEISLAEKKMPHWGIQVTWKQASQTSAWPCVYVCQVDEIKRSMVYLKPRQDLNILAPPPLTLFSRTCFSQKCIRSTARKHLTCLYDCMKPLQPFLSFSHSPTSFFLPSPLLFCSFSSSHVLFSSLLHCHLVPATHAAIKCLLSTQENTGFRHELYHQSQ